MTTTRPIAPCAAIFATADETAARALLAGLLAPMGIDIVRSGWEPHGDQGRHSRLWFWWRLADGDTDAHRAALDRLAAAVTAPADRARPWRRVEIEDGHLAVEIVAAGTVVALTLPGLVWLHLELDENPAVQADLAAALAAGSPPHLITRIRLRIR